MIYMGENKSTLDLTLGQRQ